MIGKVVPTDRLASQPYLRIRFCSSLCKVGEGKGKGIGKGVRVGIFCLGLV